MSPRELRQRPSKVAKTADGDTAGTAAAASATDGGGDVVPMNTTTDEVGGNAVDAAAQEGREEVTIDDSASSSNKMDVLKCLKYLYDSTSAITGEDDEGNETNQPIIDCLKFLNKMLTLPDTQRQSLAEDFYDNQGLLILIMCLKQYYTQSREFVQTLLGVINEITAFDERCHELIATKFNAVPIILQAAIYHRNTFVAKTKAKTDDDVEAVDDEADKTEVNGDGTAAATATEAAGGDNGGDGATAEEGGDGDGGEKAAATEEATAPTTTPKSNTSKKGKKKKTKDDQDEDPENYHGELLQKYAVMFLGNLTTSDDEQVYGPAMTLECIEYVKETMTTYFDKYSIQSTCVFYFSELSRIEGDQNEMKNLLLDKEIDQMLRDAFHLFRSAKDIPGQRKKDPYKEEKIIAQEALRRLYK